MSAPVILVDVMNLAFRAHYAFHNLSSEGRPSGLLFGFLKTIRDLRQKVSTRMVFCWDHGVPVPGAARPRNWREEVVRKYKATRKRDDAEFLQVREQLPVLYSVLTDMLGYGSVSVMEMEADDVIGILTNEYRDEVLVFSTDRDMYQLLNARIRILVPKKAGGEFRYITEAEVKKEYGIEPIRWAEYLALGGDSSDNIKPAAGMGPKTALKIVLAGAWVGMPWERQPEDFRKRFAKYELAWPECQRSLYVARLPRTWTDSRIAACLPEGPPPLPDPEPRATAAMQRKFETFCSDYGMLSLLASRRQFFGSLLSQGEKSCQTVRPPAVQRKAVALPPPQSKRRTLI